MTGIAAEKHVQNNHFNTGRNKMFLQFSKPIDNSDANVFLMCKLVMLVVEMTTCVVGVAYRVLFTKSK